MIVLLQMHSYISFVTYLRAVWVTAHETSPSVNCVTHLEGNWVGFTTDCIKTTCTLKMTPIQDLVHSTGQSCVFIDSLAHFQPVRLSFDAS